MHTDKKQQVVELLKSLETGASQPVSYINPDKYIQHNIAAADGLAGFKAFVQILPKETTKANPVRVFQDGDFVFAHVAYNVFGPKTGFDIFRFEDGKIVEHWDNLQETAAQPNPSGHTMIDGATTVTDLDKTAVNKALVRTFVDDILLHGRMEKFAAYFDGDNYIQHNPYIADQVSGLGKALQEFAKQGLTIKYDRIHAVYGEGNFVLVVSEGSFAGKPTSYYDLFRVQQGKIVEHWDVLETIPARTEWKNDNGKF
ncbi:MAG: nuclear transport factor 2 family protein [Burkholderiales bacterium]|nr:nuclear transport factor 2 family protein [Burkholderiales bacterium]